MSDGSVTTPIGVAFAGLSRRSVDVLVCAFRTRCGGRFVLRLPDKADVAVVNVEPGNAAASLQALRDKHPRLPLVAIARERPDCEVDGFVPIPIRLSLLEETLNAAVAQGQPTTAPRAPVSFLKRDGAVCMQTAIPENVHFDLDSTALGHVLSAVTEQGDHVIAFEFGEDQTLIVDRQNDLAMSTQPARALAEGCVEHNRRELPRNELPPPDSARRYPLESFLWELAVYTSNGRLPAGVTLDTPHYLTRWPDFTQLTDVPGAMRIASLWALQPRSLLSLYQNLQQPFDQLFTTFTACHAIGLAGVARRESDTLLAPATMTTGPRTGLVEAVKRRFARLGARKTA